MGRFSSTESLVFIDSTDDEDAFGDTDTESAPLPGLGFDPNEYAAGSSDAENDATATTAASRKKNTQQQQQQKVPLKRKGATETTEINEDLSAQGLEGLGETTNLDLMGYIGSFNRPGSVAANVGFHYEGTASVGSNSDDATASPGTGNVSDGSDNGTSSLATPMTAVVVAANNNNNNDVDATIIKSE